MQHSLYNRRISTAYSDELCLYIWYERWLHTLIMLIVYCYLYWSTFLTHKPFLTNILFSVDINNNTTQKIFLYLPFRIFLLIMCSTWRLIYNTYSYFHPLASFPCIHPFLLIFCWMYCSLGLPCLQLVSSLTPTCKTFTKPCFTANIPLKYFSFFAATYARVAIALPVLVFSHRFF